MTTGYCPNCGKPRTGERFCANCGNDFWKGTADKQPPSSAAPGSMPLPIAADPASARKAAWKGHARWAAIAWLAVAVLSGLLVWVGIAGSADDPALASLLLAAPAGLVSLYSAVRLFVSPSESALIGATIWAGLNALLGLWAIFSGAALESLPFLVLVAGAGVESFQAWQGRRAGRVA